MTVEHLLAEISSRELTAWQAFFLERQRRHREAAKDQEAGVDEVKVW